MEAEEVINLFDSCWFELEILNTRKIHEKFEIQKSSTLQIRSGSFCSNFPSLKLRKIPSEEVLKSNSSFGNREEMLENPIDNYKPVTRKKRRKSSKSLSELEFEELKGFMDLGFIFSEEDKDPELVSIVPGLNRLGNKGVEEMKTEDVISRPYLSEAWGDLDMKLMRKNLIDWEIQALSDETNLKQHLKVWAQTVASTLRS